ncbi:5574_t:CDS:2, partial [Cetraspora pellucida]
KVYKQTAELLEVGDKIESRQSDVHYLYMLVKTLKNLCTWLNLSTEGKKANLIEHLKCFDNLTQSPLDLLSGSEENIKSEIFVENKKIEKESKDVTEIKALLREIKYLRILILF